MPPLVGTLAFQRLLGEGGLLWRMLPDSAAGVPWLGPFAAVLILHTYAFGLFTYAFSAAALEDLDPAFEEAARSLGGGRWMVFQHALWPALRGPLAAAALLTFMAAGASFSGPYLLDTNGHYLTVEILMQQHSNDRSLVAAFTVLLAALSLAALPAFLYFQRFAPGATAASAGLKGTTGRALPRAKGWKGVLCLGISILAAVVLTVPPATVALSAFGAPGGWHATVLPPTFGLQSFQALDKSAVEALRHSVGYGAVAAVIDVALALALALALRRAPLWATLPAEGAVMLAVALPGSVVAIALLAAFNAPSWLTGGVALGQTAGILILAYVVRALPLAVRPVRAALAALGADLELAAHGLGASPGRTVRKVVIPLLRPALLTAALLCFIAGAGEFVATVLLYAPETRTASVTINTLLRDRPGGAAALALSLMLISAASILAVGWLQARGSWRARTKTDRL